MASFQGRWLKKLEMAVVDEIRGNGNGIGL